MTPNRPYLLRALFDWICDNNCTPYLLVDATLQGVEVPAEHVSGGRIVLNASGTAVVNFDITDEAVSFSTRFSGRDTWINVPMAAVLAIYAKETQEGMTFAPADYPDRKQRPEFSGEIAVESDMGRGAQAAVDGSLEDAAPSAAASKTPVKSAATLAGEKSRGEKSRGENRADEKKAGNKKGGSHLKVIK